MNRSKRTRGAGHVARMGERRDVLKFLVRKPKGTLEYLRVEEKIILKMDLL